MLAFISSSISMSSFKEGLDCSVIVVALLGILIYIIKIIIDARSVK